jgi:uncharacterized protein involved in exopolysaccharide biosynthesis
MPGIELAATAAERSGPLTWITLGLLLGLVIGFLYAAVRHAVRNRRRRP